MSEEAEGGLRVGVFWSREEEDVGFCGIKGKGQKAIEG